MRKVGGFKSSLELTVEASRWLLEKLNDLLGKDVRYGFMGSKSFHDIDLVINIKANRAGHFISLFGFQKKGAKGRAMICYPMVEKLEVRDNLISALSSCLNLMTTK